MEDFKVIEEEAVDMANPFDHGFKEEETQDEFTYDTNDDEIVVDPFDPTQIQNGFADDDDEGGIVKRGITDDDIRDNHDDDGGVTTLAKKIKIPESFELSGFTAMVNGNKSTFKSVSVMFKDFETAKASINGSKFLFVSNGKLVAADIISGAPMISDDETSLIRYVNGEWSRF